MRLGLPVSGEIFSGWCGQKFNQLRHQNYHPLTIHQEPAISRCDQAIRKQIMDESLAASLFPQRTPRSLVPDCIQLSRELRSPSLCHMAYSTSRGANAVSNIDMSAPSAARFRSLHLGSGVYAARLFTASALCSEPSRLFSSSSVRHWIWSNDDFGVCTGEHPRR